MSNLWTSLDERLTMRPIVSRPTVIWLSVNTCQRKAKGNVSHSWESTLYITHICTCTCVCTVVYTHWTASKGMHNLNEIQRTLLLTTVNHLIHGSQLLQQLKDWQLPYLLVDYRGEHDTNQHSQLVRHVKSHSMKEYNGNRKCRQSTRIKVGILNICLSGILKGKKFTENTKNDRLTNKECYLQ